MPEPIAILNGVEIAASRAAISVADVGFVHGAAVAEMIRTFGHAPFRLDDHLSRLRAGVEALGIDAAPGDGELRDAVAHVVSANGALIPDHHDLGVVIFVTAGMNQTYLGTDAAPSCTWGVHSFPLPFELWAEKIAGGGHLRVPAQTAVPPEALEPRIKWRSRAHWFLADREVRKIDPAASAILPDANGFLTETSTANLFVVRGGRLLTPRAECTLDGVSRRVALELAESLGIEWDWADLTVEDLRGADAAFTSSTPYCLMPVATINGDRVGGDDERPVFHWLMHAWNDLVGLDIIGQIETVANERR